VFTWVNTGFNDVQVISNSLIDASLSNGDVNNRRFSNIRGPAGVTLTSKGAVGFGGNNVNCHINFDLDGETSFYHPNAFGSGSVHFNSGELYANGHGARENPITMNNPLSGNVDIRARDGATFTHSVTPGSSSAAASIRVNTRTCVLASGSTLHINLWNKDVNGRLAILPWNDGTNTGLTIQPGAKLQLHPMPGFRANPGDVFVIVRNASSALINTTFAGLEEGAKVDIGGRATGNITYKHVFAADGDGIANDIAIYNIRLNGTLLLLK